MIVLVVLLFAANHFFIFDWLNSGLQWLSSELAGAGYEGAAYQVFTLGGLPQEIAPFLVFVIEVILLFVFFPRLVRFFSDADKKV